MRPLTQGIPRPSITTINSQSAHLKILFTSPRGQWVKLKSKWNNLLYKLLCNFYPRPVLASGYCRCLRVCVYVCVSVNHEFVRAVTHQPFKLGSPNLDQRCKRPWLRALLFCGMIVRDLQGQIELQSQNLPHFELVHAITHHQLKLQFPNMEQKCTLALFRSLPILGLIEIDLQFNF